MKILMINGTMRKSSTYRIAKMLIERITLSQDTVTELFLPKDMPEFCRGCGLCIRGYEKHCPDYLIYLKRVTKLIDEADVLVFTTPTYVYHATGQMKALLDHFGYRWMVHRPEGSMFKKQAVCISTSAGAGHRQAIKDITDSLRYWGVARIYTYGVSIGSMDWDAVVKPVKDKIDRKLYELMDKITHDTDKVNPTLRGKLFFAIMRQMHKREAMQAVDTLYWREMGWLGKKRPWKREKVKPQKETLELKEETDILSETERQYTQNTVKQDEYTGEYTDVSQNTLFTENETVMKSDMDTDSGTEPIYQTRIELEHVIKD